MREEEMQAEIRRRVIQEAEKADKMKNSDAELEALDEITDFSREEVDRIAKNVRGEMAEKKSFLRSVVIFSVIAFVAVMLIMTIMIVSKYNKMVSLDEDVKRSWGQVENVYQRRADLIPNLVATVQGYMQHERETLQAITEARSRTGSIAGNVFNNPEAFAKFQQTQANLSAALSRVMVVAERYPDLKANQNFLALQAQLEGSENRIAVERKRFNETVQVYNAYIKRFPQVMLAGMMGFGEKAYFKAEKGAENAPKVSFQ